MRRPRHLGCHQGLNGSATCTWIGPGVLIAFLVQNSDTESAGREVEPLVGDFLTIR